MKKKDSKNRIDFEVWKAQEKLRQENEITLKKPTIEFIVDGVPDKDFKSKYVCGMDEYDNNSKSKGA